LLLLFQLLFLGDGEEKDDENENEDERERGGDKRRLAPK